MSGLAFSVNPVEVERYENRQYSERNKYSGSCSWSCGIGVVLKTRRNLAAKARWRVSDVCRWGCLVSW